MEAIPAPPPERISVTPADLAAIQEVYEAGRALDAYRLSERIGPLRAWRGADALVLAGRLAANVGARRLAARLHLKARHEEPASLAASVWAIRAVAGRFGPYAGRRLLRRIEVGDDPEALSLAAELAVLLGDVDEAERLASRAAAAAPREPWPHVVRAMAAERADAYERGLESLERAFELRPEYRPASELRARLLILLGRDAEALEVLEDAAARFQSYTVAMELALLTLEQGRHEDAAAAVSLAEALAPLRERQLVSWIEARRSDIAHRRGDRAGAVAHARRAGIPFYENLATRLEAAPAGSGKTMLPVPWIRQHQLTCVPATMSALARHFQVAADHLEIAEAICYDGTPDHAQRSWAAGEGLVAREFTVTWPSALALLERGVPFAITTLDPGGGHMQAVVGFDRARGTLLLRDPNSRYLGEMVGEDGLREYVHCGPKGLVLLPPREAHRLDGLDLPEQDLHDLYHSVQASLVNHERAAAVRAAEELSRRAPGHRLALQAERSLASYDSDEPRRLRATEALLAAFPDEVNLRMSKQASLADLRRRDARIAWLRDECKRAGHPLLQSALAGVLGEDARASEEALRLARAAVAGGWRNGWGYHVLANVLWGRGERDEALDAYRIAACLQPTNEVFSRSYFLAARLAKQAPLALQFLRDRFERLGHKSGGPASTLHEALELLGSAREAREILDRALAWRPDDASLLLFAARTLADTEPERAKELLGQARSSARAVDVKRAEAHVVERRGDLGEAASLWSAVVEAEPFDLDAVEAAARLLDATRGSGASIAFLRARVARHPHHHHLNRLLAGHLVDGVPEEREAAIRALLEANPSDAWGWRELALALVPLRRVEEGLAAVERAAEIDPHSPTLHSVHAAVLEEAGRHEEAKAALHRSLRASLEDASQVGVVDRLVRLSADGAERERELSFVHGEIVRQVLSGDALLVYQSAAARVLDPERLVAELRAAWEARPDLWQAWAALARQLGAVGRHGEAVSLLRAAVAQRFELHPGLWVELASAYGAGGDRAEQRAALERALAIAPHRSEAVLPLAKLLHEDREFEAERALLASAVRLAPGDALLRGWLADAAWMSGGREAAIAELEHALRLEPSYAWAWEALNRFSQELGETDRPAAVAERIAAERPHDPGAWVLVARARVATSGKLEALDRALQVAPRHLLAHQLRIEALAAAGRNDEALAAAKAPIEGGRVPRALRLWAARLQADRGERGVARLEVEELLRAEPDFVEGWTQLVEWHHGSGRQSDALEAARQLERLAPHDPVSHAYVARALLGCGERADAKAALRRALELNPAFSWAMTELFDAEIVDRDADAAAVALARIERHAEDDAPLARLRLLALRKDRDGAFAELDGLARRGQRWQLDNAAFALDAAGWSDELDARLDALLDDPGAGGAAGELFAARAAYAGAWTRMMRRRHLARNLSGSAPTPATLGAAEERLRQLVSPVPRPLALRWLLARHGKPLAADMGTWGQVGYALLSARLERRTVAWLSDWRRRDGAQPWMLLNLAVALRNLGRDAESAEVSAGALARPRDHTSAMHEVLVAADAALAGDAAAAARLGQPHRELEGFYRFLVEVIEVLSTEEGQEQRSGAAPSARLREVAGRMGSLASDPYLRRVRIRAMRVVARREAGDGWLAPLRRLRAELGIR